MVDFVCALVQYIRSRTQRKREGEKETLKHMCTCTGFWWHAWDDATGPGMIESLREEKRSVINMYICMYVYLRREAIRIYICVCIHICVLKYRCICLYTYTQAHMCFILYERCSVRTSLLCLMLRQGSRAAENRIAVARTHTHTHTSMESTRWCARLGFWQAQTQMHWITHAYAIDIHKHKQTHENKHACIYIYIYIYFGLHTYTHAAESASNTGWRFLFDQSRCNAMNNRPRLKIYHTYTAQGTLCAHVLCVVTRHTHTHTHTQECSAHLNLCSIPTVPQTATGEQ